MYAWASLVRRAVLVDHQRGVEPDGAQRLERLRDLLAELRGRRRSRACAARRRPRRASRRRGRSSARLGDAFAEHGLRRRHELERLLDRALVAREQLLLDRVLGVMAGVDLVRGEVDQVEAGRRHVDVQHDAAAQIAVVVVERPPRLVGDRLDRQRLALGQLDERRGPPRAGSAAGRSAPGRRARRRRGAASRQRLAALEERPVARQQLVELARAPPRRRSCRRAPGARRSSPRPRRRTRCRRRRARARRSRSPSPGRRASRPAARRAAHRRRQRAAPRRSLPSASTCCCSSAGP